MSNGIAYSAFKSEKKNPFLSKINYLASEIRYPKKKNYYFQLIIHENPYI